MIKTRVNGIDCVLYYDERLKPEQAPIGYPYMYHLRHDEDDWGCPVLLEKIVWVNFFGTVFFKEPIDFENQKYIEVEDFKMERELIPFSMRSGVFKKMFGLRK